MPNHIRVITSKTDVFVTVNRHLTFQSKYSNFDDLEHIQQCAKALAFDLAVKTNVAICHNIEMPDASSDLVLNSDYAD